MERIRPFIGATVQHKETGETKEVVLVLIGTEARKVMSPLYDKAVNAPTEDERISLLREHSKLSIKYKDCLDIVVRDFKDHNAPGFEKTTTWSWEDCNVLPIAKQLTTAYSAIQSLVNNEDPEFWEDLVSTVKKLPGV